VVDLLLIVSLHVYMSYILKYMLHFLMFMNLKIHNTKRLLIQDISSPIHNLYLNSTTIYDVFMSLLSLERPLHVSCGSKQEY